MAIKLKILLTLASLLVAGAIFYDAWLWQPARQVRLHHAHLLHAAEKRNWTSFGAFIDARYADRWGHDQPFVVRETREVLRQFFVLTIQSENTACEVAGTHATVTARLKLDGTGTALAQLAQDKVNALREPFVFTWTRAIWKPWDWRLTCADQAELHFSDWRD